MNIVKQLRLSDPYQVGYDINSYYRECHDHDFYEILLIISGSTVHCVNDSVQILKAGDMVCIRPSDAHFVTPYSALTDKFEFFNIHISCRDMQTQFERSRELKAKIDDPSLPTVVNLGTNEFLFITKKMRTLNSMVFGEKRTFLYYSILKDLLWQVIAKATPIAEKQLPEWFERYLMSLSRSDVFTLDYTKIVEASNVSSSYLWKIFKKYLNMTPTEYINNIRLEYAYELITGTKRSLGEIASMAGFNNYSYFYKKFSEKYDISPKEFRKKVNI